MTSSLATANPSPRHSSPFLVSPLPPLSPSPTPNSPLSSNGKPQQLKWNMQQSSNSDDSELTLARKWIEDCTGCIEKQKGFREYLQDGTLLCELVQRVRPDLIKRIKRVKSPFAWRENVAFFLEACKSLGLKGSQLFSPEDLIASGARTPTIKTKGFRGENERKLRNVAITVFWLSRVIRRLPNYTGPLLDFDPSTLGDWEHSETLLTVTGEGSENRISSPTTSSSYQINTHNYSHPEHQPPSQSQSQSRQQSPPHQKSHSPPSSSSSSSPPLPISPYQSPTIKVKRVEGIVTHTDQTSYPQVIVHVGRRGHRRSSSSGPTHSRSNSLTDARTGQHPPRQLQKSGKTTSASALQSIESTFEEQKKALCELTQESTLTEKTLVKEPAVQVTDQLLQNSSAIDFVTDKPLQSSNPTVFLNGDREEEEEEVDKGIEDTVSLGDLINAELELNRQRFELESNSYQPNTHRSPSVTSSTPSEVSTIVPRDLALSRCSALSFPEDNTTCNNGQNLTTSESDPNTNLLQPSHYLSTSEANQNTDSIKHPLHTSLINEQESPHSVCEGEPTVEISGTQTLFRNSPLLDVDSLLNTHQLSDKSSEPSVEEDSIFPSLTISAPSPQPEQNLISTFDPSSSLGESPLQQFDHIIEEGDSNQPHKESESVLTHSLTDSLHTNQKKNHPVISALKEDYHKSFHSSCSSIDSIAYSVIEVTYCLPTDSDATTSSAPQQPNDADTNTATSSAYYSSSSENENESDSSNYEVVPAETINHYLVDLQGSEPEVTPNKTGSSNALTRYHSLPNFEQVDLETIPEEMAVTTQVMRIYPAQSVGEISSNVTSVPHHRVHIQSSSSTNGLDPESPSKHSFTEHTSSMVLCTSPPTTSQANITESNLEPQQLIHEGTNSVQEVVPSLMTSTAIHILHDDEDEQDTMPANTHTRKTSRGLTSDSSFSKLNFTLALPPLGGGGSLARVQSDALPLTLHAAKLTVPETGGDENSSERDELADLSDFNSMAVEFQSSVDSLNSSRVSLATSNPSTSSLPLSQRSVSSSALGSHGELHAHIPGGGLRHRKQQSDDSFVESVLAPSHGGNSNHTKGPGVLPFNKARPTSAPTRAISDSVLPSPTSSPYTSDSMNILKIRGRRTSAESKRQQRLANINESARAALTFTAIHRSKKSESLPRDQQLQHWRNHSDSKSACSEDELLGSSPSSNSILEKSASGVGSVENTKMVVPDPSSPSPLFNLHSLSIDETRKASVTEMEEIWKLVENESGSSSGSDTCGVSGVMGGGSSRGPPSIALERHVSPQHSSSNNIMKTEKITEKKLQSWNPQQGVDLVDGETEKIILENGHHSYNMFETAECTVDVNRGIPLHSTPKRPGLRQPDMSAFPIGEMPHKPSPVTKKDFDSLLTTLKSLGEGEGRSGREEREDGKGLRLLEQMLHSKTFKRAQKVHDTVQQLVSHDDTAPRPVVRRSVPIAQETRHHFHHHTEPSDEVDELRSLLRQSHIQALLFCHDRVSTEDYHLPRRHYPRIKQDPVDLILSSSVLNYVPPTTILDNSLPLSRDVPSTRKEDATIVYLQRSNRPLGCTIYKQGEAVFVGKLLKGCDAGLSEVLREGDELLEVNGVPVIGRSTDEIVRLMSGEAGVTLAFTIIPLHDDNIDLNYEPKYVRAHFNYSPMTDDEIPCQPLGLKFEKGDIMEISNQDDPDWWQARKVFDDGAESLPGLIPARHRQQQREALTRSYPLAKAMEDQQRKKKGLMSKLSRKKKKTVFYNQGHQHGVLAVGDEVVTYEDVVKMDPHPQWRRPIILIGASGVGKGTLIRKLINSDHTHFAAVVQHTTRAIHPGEVNGHTYHFVTREEFEQDILHERFLEHEEVKSHLYGTSVSAIKKIVESGRVPVLDLQPQSLKRVRYSGLMPYVVFVASPRLERLVLTRRVGPERPSPVRRRITSTSSASYDMDSSQIYTEPELQHLLVESRLIETQYSHYFDWIIVNDDLSVASDMLKEVARRAEETQWVPASWMSVDHSF